MYNLCLWYMISLTMAAITFPGLRLVPSFVRPTRCWRHGKWLRDGRRRCRCCSRFQGDLGGSDIGTGKNWWNKGGPDFFCFFWLLMGLTWFKMVYMSSIFMGGVPKVLPTYTHRILWINLRKQIGFRKDLPRPFPCLWGGRWDQPRSHTTPPWHLPCVGSVGHWCWSWWQRCDGGRWRWHDVTRFVICQPNLWLL